MELLESCYAFRWVDSSFGQADDGASRCVGGLHSCNAVFKDKAIFCFDAKHVCCRQVHVRCWFSVFDLITADGGGEEVTADGVDSHVGEFPDGVGGHHHGHALLRQFGEQLTHTRIGGKFLLEKFSDTFKGDVVVVPEDVIGEGDACVVGADSNGFFECNADYFLVKFWGELPAHFFAHLIGGNPPQWL